MEWWRSRLELTFVCQKTVDGRKIPHSKISIMLFFQKVKVMINPVENIRNLNLDRLIIYQNGICGVLSNIWKAKTHDMRMCGMKDGLKGSQGAGNGKSSHKNFQFAKQFLEKLFLFREGVTNGSKGVAILNIMNTWSTTGLDFVPQYEWCIEFDQKTPKFHQKVKKRHTAQKNGSC